MRSDSLFKRVLGAAQVQHLERSQDSIVGIGPDLRIQYFNPAWERFAVENGAVDLVARFPIGASILDGISGPVRGLFELQLRRVYAGGRIWEHEYECSTVRTVREMRMLVHPLSVGLLMTHSCLRELPRSEEGVVDPTPYMRDRVVVMCSHCRRTRAPGTERWDWVPALVEAPPPMTSHGLCPSCFAHHYPEE